MSDMCDTGRCVERVGDYGVFEWSGPGVDSGAVKPYSVSLRGRFNWTRYDTLDEARSAAAGMPKMRRVEVSFDVLVPEGVTEDHVEEWVEFSLGSGSIAGSNPLVDEDLRASHVTVSFR